MNILDLVKNFSIEPKLASVSKGGEYWSSCPACGGTDRFHVWPAQNNGSGSYWCRKCGRAGDAIQFLIDFDGKSYPEAAAALGRKIKKNNRIRPANPSSMRKTGGHSSFWAPRPSSAPQSGLWRKKAGIFIDWCHKNLLADQKTLGFLADRGIDRDTAVFFRLGVNPGKDGRHLFRPRESWGLPTVMKNGRKKKLWLPAGLVIPLMDSSGRVCRIRIRLFDPGEKEPRYYVVPGSSSDTLVIGRNRDAFVVVESELDAMAIHAAAGEVVGVCGLGSSSTRPDADAASRLKKALFILCALDADSAGAAASAWWLKHFRQAERWPAPAAKDPGDAFAAGLDLRKWILAGLPPRWKIAAGIKKPQKSNIVIGIGKDDVVDMKSPPKQAKSNDPVCSALLTLGSLMSGHPVSILVGNSRVKIDYPDLWASSHWDRLGRISDCIYFNPYIFSYVRRLSPGRYNGRFFAGKGAG